MINVSRVLQSKNFTQSFDVYRKTTTWDAGRPDSTETKITLSGVVTPTKPKELQQVPEGDRVTGMMSFHCQQELFVTRESGISDEIVWRNERYKIISVSIYADYGYYKAYGVRVVSD